MTEPAGRSAESELDKLALDSAVASAKTGDEAAIRFLYRTLQPKILNYLRAMVGDADAEDVASETWSRIARDLRTFRGDGNGFRAWTVTIARHRAIDHLRRRRPATPLSPQDIPHQPARDDPATDAIAAIDTSAALAVIAQLPTDQAQAILLRVVVGLDTATAAKVLGKGAGAVRTATYRGLRNLAKRLSPQDVADNGERTAPARLPWAPTPRHTGA